MDIYFCLYGSTSATQWTQSCTKPLLLHSAAYLCIDLTGLPQSVGLHKFGSSWVKPSVRRGWWAMCSNPYNQQQPVAGSGTANACPSLAGHESSFFEPSLLCYSPYSPEQNTAFLALSEQDQQCVNLFGILWEERHFTKLTIIIFTMQRAIYILLYL